MAPEQDKSSGPTPLETSHPKAAFTHAVGVEKGFLAHLACEEQMVDAEPSLSGVKMVEGVVAANKRARETANGLLKGIEDMSGQCVLTTFKKKHSIMTGLDRRWCIEYCLIESHVGQKGEQRLKQRILSCLPSQQTDMTVEESLGRLTTLQTSALVSFCGIGMTSVFDGIFEWVRALSRDRAPTFTGDSSDFMAQVKARLCNFCRLERTAEEGGPLTGKPAVLAIYASIHAAIEAKEDFGGLTALGPLIKFGWVLAADQSRSVKAWTDAEFAKGSSATNVGPSAKKSGNNRRKTDGDALSKLEALMKG